ncbi:dihydroneopterin aldolase [Capnocytophaga sp. oral taxon 863 str. F0517]|uniref:dihydroneopterin aldolase n=1 Tax=Capnocytophaga sp. oral taxon 863 TaxID=1227265 RepID=UPI000396EFAA|nr:dihydroneopterin aldolase [Capnocytophaga sp. oral taxon 863]ERI64087.1 dihydroneopterin aldolase [Capnocytophaga sp. oral taxon 863 str. F0517]
MKTSITLEDIRVYAYHGCLQEEARIGSWYRVDLTVWADLSTSIQSDRLSDTIDYVRLNQIVKEQMAIRSQLLEHVAGRILQVIKADFQEVTSVEVEVAKINPPIGGDVGQVSVKIIE